MWWARTSPAPHFLEGTHVDTDLRCVCTICFVFARACVPNARTRFQTMTAEEVSIDSIAGQCVYCDSLSN